MRVGPYDESMYYSLDYDMILRLARRNEGVFIDDPVLYQRKHLGYRGPSAEETFKLDTVGKWMKYDAILFKKLDREWSLSDFQPFHHEGRPLHQRALALLQKGVILFQRKVYHGAMRALTEYGRELRDHSSSPVELKIATGLLGCRYGVEDLVAKDSSGSDIIHAFRSIHWPLSMRVAFASQIRWRIRTALAVGNVRYALALAKLSCRTFGPSATAAVLGSRCSFGASQWRLSN